MQSTKQAHPGPIGLIGFGIANILAQLHNVNILPASSLLILMGLFGGGLAQVLSGLLDFRQGNTLGATSSIMYGFFWIIGFSMLYVPPPSGFVLNDHISLGIYAVLWGLFTLVLFICSLKDSLASQIVFGTLTIQYIFAAVGNLLNNPLIMIIGGFEGIICGLSALYLGFAILVNEEYGRKVWPLGKVSVRLNAFD